MAKDPNDDKRLLSRREVIRYAGAGAVAALLTGAYGAVECSAVVVERRELRLPKWNADGFRVAVISDIHANDEIAAARTQTAVHLALAEKPDLIVLPGDFVNFSWWYTLDTMVGALEGLHQAKCPVIATMGNHDYWTHNPQNVIDAIQKRTRMLLLRNESVDVDGVTVAGVDDAIANMYDPRFMNNLDNKSLLVLLHEPDFVKYIPTHASLQISGHSHGGQMCLPFGIPLHTPYGSWQYKKGFYPDAPIPLYVTRGIGTVGAPLRTFCRPEVSLLTLRNAA
jgi:predicted MPP superfamily phosphohydrolase